MTIHWESLYWCPIFAVPLNYDRYTNVRIDLTTCSRLHHSQIGSKIAYYQMKTSQRYDSLALSSYMSFSVLLYPLLDRNKVGIRGCSKAYLKGIPGKTWTLRSKTTCLRRDLVSSPGLLTSYLSKYLWVMFLRKF